MTSKCLKLKWSHKWRGAGGQVVSLQCFEPFDGVSMVLRVQLSWQPICSDAVNLSNPNSD